MSHSIKPLIISYYWPPAGGPGVQRWLKFSKYLTEFGIAPTVIVPSNPSYPFEDLSLVSEIPSDISIIKIPIWEPHHLAEWIYPKSKKFKAGQFDIPEKRKNLIAKLLIFIRGNLFIPDSRVFWVRRVSKFLGQYVQEHSFSHIITTGPPHSVHLIALCLKKKFPQMKWVADFRDPWTEISYHSSLMLTGFAQKKHKKLEREVLSQADLVISTSFTDRENFIRLGAKYALTITNGFDDYPVEREKPNTDKFIVTYSGVLEQLRNPSPIWKAFSELVQEYPSLKNQLVLRFIGRVDEAILQELYQLGLTENIEQLGYLQHIKVVQKLYESHLLLLTNFTSDVGKGIIPGKLFEYISTGIPVLSFGPEGGDVAQILEECEAGIHFSTANSLEEIKIFIQSEFEKDRKLRTPHPNVSRFHRKTLTQKLIEALQEL